MASASSLIGASVRRTEDRRFLTGRGRYVDDLPLEGALHIALVRSMHAHARVSRVDRARLRGLPGIAGVFTLDDLPELREALPPPAVAAVSLQAYRQSALADGRVRFVGEPIAVVVASDPYRAADGAAAVTVDYEPLPAAIDAEWALAADAPLVHSDWGTNLAASVALARGDADAALAGADIVVTRRFSFGRMNAATLETRAVAARSSSAIPATSWSPTAAPRSRALPIAGSTSGPSPPSPSAPRSSGSSASPGSARRATSRPRA